MVVLLNPKAGSTVDGERAPGRLADVLRSFGWTGEVWSVSHDDLRRRTRDAVGSGADVVVAAGGDGTVSTVASALIDTGVPLGILPLGTLNHFARDLGIPNGLEPAAAVLASAAPLAVDVGEVNGRLFLNNVSLGVYPVFVRARRRASRHSRIGWLLRLRSQLSAAWRVVARATGSRLRVRIEGGGLYVTDRTSLVLVGNNELGVSPSLR